MASLLSIILPLLVLLVRAEVVITSIIDDEDEFLANKQQRRLLKSLDSNPQFYTPPQQPQQQRQQSLEASNVLGLLFNVRTKVDGSIQFTGFEFYTTPTTDSNLYYELYTKEGEYWEAEDVLDGGAFVGGLDTFDLISQGLTRGSGNCTETFQDTALYCTLAVVPDQGFIQSQWIISEKMSSRTFYITLSSKNLVAQRKNRVAQGSNPTTQQSADERVVASTPELELYDGIGTKTYPLSSNREYYYDTPMGFIGKIHYNEDPQLVAPAPSPIATPQQQPTQPPTSIGTSPTPKPTRPKCRPGRPCLTQPAPDTGDGVTSIPITSPTTTIRTIVYIENTPDRALETREISKYIEVMTKFLDQSTSLTNNDVTTMNMTVFNDDLIEEPDGKKRAGRSGRSGGGSLRKNRLLSNDKINATDSYSYYHNEVGGLYIPKIYPAIFVQTEFLVQTNLPYDVAAFYLWNEFRTNEEELVKQFHDNSLFVSYFRDILNVTVQVVNELIAPTAAPTKFIENTTIIDSENSAQQDFGNIWLYLGITIGVVWFVLTCCSLRHILKHRRRQRYRADLRRLTNQYSSFGSKNRERFSMTMFSPKTVIKTVSFALTRSRHRKNARDEESQRSDGDSLESFS